MSIFIKLLSSFGALMVLVIGINLINGWLGNVPFWGFMSLSMLFGVVIFWFIGIWGKHDKAKPEA